MASIEQLKATTLDAIDARRRALGPWSPIEVGLAGLHAECVEWLRDRDAERAQMAMRQVAGDLVALGSEPQEIDDLVG